MESSRCPIIHFVSSTKTRAGIEATLILQPEDDFEGVALDDLESNSVYLTPIEKNSKTKLLSESISKSICMPIAVYLDLLLFIQTVWPIIEENMQKQLDTIRNISDENQSSHSIQTKVEGSCTYQHWFETIFFHVQKQSHNPQPVLVHLQKQNISIELDLHVLKKMSLNYQEMKTILMQSNYVIEN